MSDEKKDKIQVMPGLKPGKMPVEQSLEIGQSNLIEQFRLRESTTIGQIAFWLLTKDFECHAERLRMHFSDKLRILSLQLGLTKENFQLAIGKETLPTELTWNEIDALMNGLVQIMSTQDQYEERVAELMEFPAEKYDDLMACIEEGVEYEKEMQKKVRPI